MHHGVKERKRYNLVPERRENARDEWNKDRTKRLTFINRLRQKNEAELCINNFDEAMLDYHRVFATQIKLIQPRAQLSYFYYPSEGQKNHQFYGIQRAENICFLQVPLINNRQKAKEGIITT